MTDRGTGYNYCLEGDMSQWEDLPDQRIEANATGSDLRTGWPSVARYGNNGEIVVSHTGNGLVYYVRENSGEGVWNGPHSIPNPVGLEGQMYSYSMAWPRVTTSGDNNNIIHVVAAAQYQVDSETMSTVQLYCRSTDGENWEVKWSPLYSSGEHINAYSADDYAISANGNNVAIVYCGSLQHHVVMYKSSDNGENWTRTVVWENPYYGCDWNEECSIYTDTLQGPAHSSLTIDNNGLAHVAISTYRYLHSELGSTYSIWMNHPSNDGIVYWNENQEAPIQSSNGNPHDALRLWWETNAGFTIPPSDNVRFCGWFPGNDEEGTGYLGFNQNCLYNENDYFYAMFGLSAYPAIAVDPMGNLAVAYSSIDITRFYDDTDDMSQYYHRSVFVSYKPYNSDEWNVAAINLMKDDEFADDEAVMVTSVSNPVNENEFWFSCFTDEIPGFYSGNNANQSVITENKLKVFKVDISNLNGEVDGLTFKQNGEQVSPGNYQVIGDVDASYELTFELDVINNSEETKNVTCEKVLVFGDGEEYFCWGQCYDADTYTANLNIAPGTTASFSSHFMPIDENGDLIPNREMKIEYHFYDDTSDEHYVFEVYYKYHPINNDLLYERNRNVVIEEFTGRNCVFCPGGHYETNSLMNQYPDRVFAVNISSISSLSPPTYPNLNTDDGAIMTGAFGVTGLPSGIVNRTTSATDINDFRPYTEEQLSQIAEVNISGEVDIDKDYRTSEITVHMYYTDNSSVNTNYLTIMMLQDSIWGSQSGGDSNPAQGDEENYCHMHVLRDVITPIKGEPIAPTTEGSYIIKKYNYSIPEIIGSPNGVEVDLDNIYFLAFVSEDCDQFVPSNPILNSVMLDNKENDDENVDSNYWVVDPYLYPNKMVMMASLHINGQEQNSGNYEVAAFCDNELRGSARLQYVGYPIDRYLAFMTIYGNNGDELVFQLYDHDSSAESDLTHQGGLIFEKNTNVGSLEEPYVLNFGSVFVVNADCNPNNAGSVSGGGTYCFGDVCELKALPNDGFVFYNWTKNNEEVSNDNIYSFVVESDMNLVANFNVFEAPENVQATVVDEQSIKITWDAVDGVSNYRIYRDGELLDDVQGTSYTDNDLESNTEYCYLLSCVKDEVESLYSEQACAKTDNVSLMELGYEFGLYPNPVEDNLVIQADCQIREINIYTMSGVLVLKCSNPQNDMINVSELCNGLYVVKITTDKHNVFQRFVKM